MNQDERFQQRWEFRSSEVDGGTSSDDDDEGSNPGGEPTDKRHNAVTALVLYENDDQGSQKHDDNKPSGISSKASKADEKKKKPSKKKKVVQKKKGAVKETKRKRKHSINDKAMFKDLKVFAESLIHELAAARESMFADMRDEIRKLAASRPNKGLVKTNVRRPVQGNVACDTRAETGKQAQGLDLSRANHELQKDDRARLSAMVNMNQLINGHIPSMDNNNSGSGIDICRLMAARTLSRRLAEFQPQEQLGGFALNYHKNWGLYGETRPYTSHGVGFPVPVHQGTDIYFNRSSMSFMDGIGVNARFASTSGASLGGMVPKGIVGSTPAPRKSDGEFERSQGKKDARFNYPTNKG